VLLDTDETSMQSLCVELPVMDIDPTSHIHGMRCVIESSSTMEVHQTHSNFIDGAALSSNGFPPQM